jgi:hypothetical protein
MAAKMVRMSFTLPPSVGADLKYLSDRIGVTRSALLAELLGGPLQDLRGLVEQVPKKPRRCDVVRFRGASEAIATKRIDSLKGMTDDLLANKE